jgi:DNA polymerase
VRELDPADTRDWRTSLRDAGVDVSVNVEIPSVVAAPPLDTPAGIESPEAKPTDDMAFKKGIVVGADEADLIPDAIAKLRSLDEVAEMVKSCTRCSLHKTANKSVPGEGDPHAQLVCVGEAPGAKEDETGRPFIGQAGQLLTKILAAVDLTREQVFIVNVLKHRPPANRNPLPDEVEACSPYLIRQLELIKPKVIVAFGTFAAQTLLNTKTPLGQLRGLVHRYHGIPLIVTYHPAALLRNPAWKRPTWEDVKLARRILDSAPRS